MSNPNDEEKVIVWIDDEEEYNPWFDKD